MNIPSNHQRSSLSQRCSIQTFLKKMEGLVLIFSELSGCQPLTFPPSYWASSVCWATPTQNSQPISWLLGSSRRISRNIWEKWRSAWSGPGLMTRFFKSTREGCSRWTPSPTWMVFPLLLFLLLLVHPLHHQREDGRQQRKKWWDITRWWARRTSAACATSESGMPAQKKVDFVGSWAQCGNTSRSAIQRRRVGLTKLFLASKSFDTELASIGNFRCVRVYVSLGSVINLDFPFLYLHHINKEFDLWN